MTVSWDRCIHVYGDRSQHEVTLLRKVTAAHSADIVAVAVSRSLSVIATGADDGSIALWDFQVKAASLPGSWHVCLLFIGWLSLGHVAWCDLASPLFMGA